MIASIDNDSRAMFNDIISDGVVYLETTIFMGLPIWKKQVIPW